VLVVEASVEHHARCASGFEKREEGEEFESEAENERKKANRTSRSKKRGEGREGPVVSVTGQNRISQDDEVTGIEQGHEMGVGNWCRIDCRTRKGNGDKASVVTIRR
jgi:hypothetical protein